MTMVAQNLGSSLGTFEYICLDFPRGRRTSEQKSYRRGDHLFVIGATLKFLEDCSIHTLLQMLPVENDGASSSLESGDGITSAAIRSHVWAILQCRNASNLSVTCRVLG